MGSGALFVIAAHTAFASRLAPTEKQKQNIAALGSSYTR